jgi:hypothetical protein
MMARVRFPRQPSISRVSVEQDDDAKAIAGFVEQGARIVHLQFFVWKVSHISSVEQTFQCRFNLRASYAEEAVKLNRTEVMTQWDASCFTFKPQLRFTSLLEEVSEREEWWRVTGDNFAKEVSPADLGDLSDKVWVHQNMRISGLFEEKFELRSFPLDLQFLHISITSSWDTSQLALRFSELQRSSVSANASISQLFDMHKPRLLAFDSGQWVHGQDLALLSMPEESRTGVRYCRAHIALTLKRHATYYVWNIGTMQLLICLAGYSTFAIEPEAVSDRLANIITLILASAAFKFVTTSMLPETPYVTIIDELNYFVLAQQAFILLFVSVFARAGLTAQSVDDVFALAMVASLGGFLLLYLIRVFHAHSKRERLLEAINEAYERYYRR